jgi:hypothetical protein
LVHREFRDPPVFRVQQALKDLLVHRVFVASRELKEVLV